MRVICDRKKNGCHKEFDVEQDLFKIKEIKMGNEHCNVKYFVCPHCGLKYILLVDTAEIRNLTAEILKINKKLSHKPMNKKEIEKHNKFVKKKDSVRKKLADRQRELNIYVYQRL